MNALSLKDSTGRTLGEIQDLLTREDLHGKGNRVPNGELLDALKHDPKWSVCAVCGIKQRAHVGVWVEIHHIWRSNEITALVPLCHRRWTGSVDCHPHVPGMLPQILYARYRFDPATVNWQRMLELQWDARGSLLPDPVEFEIGRLTLKQLAAEKRSLSSMEKAMNDYALYALAAMYLAFAAWHVRRLRRPKPKPNVEKWAVGCTMSNGQNYIVVFDQESRWQVRWTFERWMSDPEINMPVEAAMEMNTALEAAGASRAETERG